MEPRIQYAKTKDGVNIAFYAIGDGPATVYMAPPASSHLQFEWQITGLRQMYERAARHSTYVRLDPRGFGLSDRDVTDFSVDAMVRDLEAVTDRLRLDRFRLVATADATLIAIAYAARHAHRISRLVLWCGVARGEDNRWPARVQALRGLIETDWEFASGALMLGQMGMQEEELRPEYGELLRRAVTPEAFLLYTRQIARWDVTSLLPALAVPTLVAHRREYPLIGVDVARNLATSIPNARLVLLEGRSFMMGPEVNSVIGAFFREDEEAEPTEAGGFRTVLFTDVEGSTALTDRLGDAKARDLLREHERMIREALESHGGSEVKALGDGFMTSFSSAVRALECAIAVQRAFAAHNESAEEPILVRVGLNAGEPIAEDDDLYGTAVNLAARITAEGKGGEILASEAVRQIVAGKKFPFSDRGETTLRGFEDPVHVYEVSWREEG